MNSVASDPVLIGIDWGTSSLRAFLIGAQGEVLDRISTSQGIMHVPNRDFDLVFNALVSEWPAACNVPVIASGMITSRNGWVETPYINVPSGAQELAENLMSFETADGTIVRFVTGMTTEHNGAPDVMRGEETQIVGAFSLGMGDGVVVMPGTHSKWVTVRAGKIEDYATFMTGEIFAALRGYTILGTLMEDGPFNETGFRMGVLAGLREGSNLLHDLFHVRTMPLFGRISADMVADYLSGMLIGAEISAHMPDNEISDLITIVGRDDLADRYETAMGIAGLTSQRAPDDIVALGHFLIAQSAGLIL
ncbi:2-dehydro-3-deoxygalactonokinase [Pseudohalocynthiibacter aestuariivivens]|jgi:2-dehydro-3-deoxygalactonokinase|uniref:2-dehydro-3-deoxygalactonokinase n=1 Tax=Pseudohalocynthiibacter aestuariivivens TaxID=1591409 RepID=A0ABV5JDY3_9RHOB|nr:MULTISPECIES: 2-dehydro-3-deoxygalactonokinase [Pseudohalocynthiibacter]MBS9718068.1 2-dehydro-3-deoxygalactonokinase [Pseudohalocynthiibacter aestuariivivens]MCK0103277.1 2-dehydro-3-deoxygalactonokinase [Pseudohalocynthiibacter sp. F2068]